MSRRFRIARIRFVLAVLIVLLGLTASVPPAHAQQTPPDSLRLERLVDLGKLWGTVKYFHPYLAYRAIDWDSALVATIPTVEAATDSASYAAAVQTMLDALDDPATRIVEVDFPPMPPPGEPDPLSYWTVDSMLVVTLNPKTLGQDFFAAVGKLRGVAAEAGKARGLVFDLRSEFPIGLDYYLQWSGLDKALAAVPLAPPGQRKRLHMGYPPQQGMSSGGYYNGFTTSNGQYIAPSGSGIDAPVVFLINESGGIPSLALALQEAGRAAVVSEGTVSDAALVETHTVAMSDGVQASVRLGELIYPDGTAGFAPNLSVDGADEAVQRSLMLAQNFEPRPASRRPVAATAALPPDQAYADPAYPSLEYRILGAYRIWAVINYFFPYLDLMDDDWDEVFRAYLPRFIQAEDAAAYHLAVAEMYAHIRDTHGFLRSEVLNEHHGTGSPPFYLRWIEDAPVVVKYLDDEIAPASGIEIGDVILTVDGKDAVELAHHHTQYIAASTQQALMSRAVGQILSGPDSSKAVLTVRGKNGQVKTVEALRRAGWPRYTYRTGEVVRMLDDNIGYADLDRLTPAQVPAMFDQFKDTDAIIFDMRGYPNGTAWTIAPYLAEEPQAGAALFDRPMILGPGRSGRQQYTFTQRIPAPGPHVTRYEGKTVMLIDERTISQAEHTGLFFEAANGTVFIGSHTNGANGDVTGFFVPGGIRLGFTGQSVRHADGRQLQRLGLVPHVEVKPTIQGLRAGEDEVLQAAVEYLTSMPGK